MFGSVAQGLRVGLFELTSALTTTGFSTVGYGNWPAFAVFAMIILMLIGGGINSTGGGLKQHRAYLLVKNIIWSISAGIRPNRMVHERSIWRVDRNQHVNPKELADVSLFATLYFLTYVLGVMALLLFGVGLRDAMFEFASSLATVGLSIGVTGPATVPGILLVEIVGMFLGRLELVVIFVGFGKMVLDLKDSTHKRRLAPVK
jgi:trk system potassium uptake protein TrkH